VERVRKSNHLLNILDNAELKAQMVAMPAGEDAYRIFEAAISEEMERLVDPSKVPTAVVAGDIVEAAAKVAELLGKAEHSHEVLSQLIEGLVARLQGVMRTQPAVRAVPQPSQQLPRRRGLQMPDLSSIDEDGEDQEIAGPPVGYA
jgi:hypothetical protein